MRKERQAVVSDVSDQLHVVETAMHTVMTEHARLGLTILDARARARLSPLVGHQVLSTHAAGHEALTRFMQHMVACHSELRDLGAIVMPGLAIGDTAAPPSASLVQGETPVPTLRVAA